MSDDTTNRAMPEDSTGEEIPAPSTGRQFSTVSIDSGPCVLRDFNNTGEVLALIEGDLYK